jgi:formylglycine-generating enzyme required for sulfatase activity
MEKWAWVGLVLAGLLACGGKTHHPSPQPVIEKFEANRTRIDPGSEVLLTARYAHGIGKVAPECGGLASGAELRVRPMQTTTYTLTVSQNRWRTIERQVTVEVNPGLKVRVKGFEGIVGPVTLTGPSDYRRTLNASGLLTGLEPGDYTVTAEPVQYGATALHPLQPVQHLRLSTGAAVTVQYPAPTLMVAVPGAKPLAFVLIPAGQFLMGRNQPMEPILFPNPSPAHQVTLPRAFYMARHLTTQGQWLALTGYNPSRRTDPQFNPSGVIDLEEAVDTVGIVDIKASFLPKLRAQMPGHRFRLPSEAEWEYACRAGTTTTYFHGDDPAERGKYAWTYDSYHGHPSHPVGALLPNPWGLYDLSGLLFQWCEDLPHDGYSGAPTDGSAWVEPQPAGRVEHHHIIRGYGPLIPPGLHLVGSSTARWTNHQSGHESVGFRLVADVPVR